MTEKMKAELVDKHAVAARYGVHEKTVRRWVGLGMPAHRPPRGKKLLFLLAEVDAWTLQQHAAGVTTEVANAAHQ